jgi:DNA-binding MarR family transcriptional regulator
MESASFPGIARSQFPEFFGVPGRRKERSMVQQREVLQLIRARGREGRTTSYRTLVRHFELSPESACGHLKRLWREGLIRSSEIPASRGRALGPGESIRDLRFELTRRGKARLGWYEDRDREAEEEGWPW